MKNKKLNLDVICEPEGLKKKRKVHHFTIKVADMVGPEKWIKEIIIKTSHTHTHKRNK